MIPDRPSTVNRLVHVEDASKGFWIELGTGFDGSFAVILHVVGLASEAEANSLAVNFWDTLEASGFTQRKPPQ
jgi:hypothetical protein